MNEHAGREQEIEAREKAATPGPWWIEAGRLMGQCKEGYERCATFIVDELDDPEGEDEVFIAHAREDISYLLAQLREAREKLAAVEIWVKRNREQDKWPDFRDWPELDRILKGGD